MIEPLAGQLVRGGAGVTFAYRSLGDIVSAAGLTATKVALLADVPFAAVDTRWSDEKWLDYTHGRLRRDLVRAVPAIGDYAQDEARAQLARWADGLHRCGVDLTDDETTADDLRQACRTKLGAEHLEHALDCLGERDRTAVILWLGLDGHEPGTLESVGKALGLSKERIRQLIDRSSRKLHAAERRGIVSAQVISAMIASRQQPHGPQLPSSRAPLGSFRVVEWML